MTESCSTRHPACNCHPVGARLVTCGFQPRQVGGNDLPPARYTPRC